MTDGIMLAVPREETAAQAEARQRLRKLAAARKRAARKAAEDELAAVQHALDIGVRQVDVARDLERSREHIRLITRPDPQ